jgi:hypothetical protein
MPLFFGKFNPSREAAMSIAQVLPAMVMAVSDETSRSCSIANWENEGGHLASRERRVPLPVFSSGEIERLQTQVNLASVKLASDFANGRVGTRYNTYAHRARVLRLQKAELGAMRARLNEPEQSQ